MGYLLLFELHWFAAVVYLTGAGFSHNKLRAAFGANVSLAYLIRHVKSSFST